MHVPPPSAAERAGGGRPLAAIVRQPVFVVAVLAGGAGLRPDEPADDGDAAGDELLRVTRTRAAAFVIEWHVVGMYAPGLRDRPLIRRFGMLASSSPASALVAACAVVALNGNTVAHFWTALALLGVGWNFMYTAARRC